VLTDEPDLLTGHVLSTAIADALGRTVGNPHPHRGEPSGEPALGAPPPAHSLPVGLGQHRLSRERGLIGNVPLARTAAACEGEDEGNIARVDLLVARNPDSPRQAARAQALAERRAQAVAGISQHDAERDSGDDGSVDLGQRHFGLGPEGAVLMRDAGFVQAGGISSPALGQEQAQADRNRNLTLGQRRRNERLAVRGLAERRGVLGRDAHRVLALLRERRVVDDEIRVGPAHQTPGLGQEFGLERGGIPHPRRDKVVKTVVAA
jgi:hypothetical protein